MATIENGAMVTPEPVLQRDLTLTTAWTPVIENGVTNCMLIVLVLKVIQVNSQPFSTISSHATRIINFRLPKYVERLSRPREHASWPQGVEKIYSSRCDLHLHFIEALIPSLLARRTQIVPYHRSILKVGPMNVGQ